MFKRKIVTLLAIASFSILSLCLFTTIDKNTTITASQNTISPLTFDSLATTLFLEDVTSDGLTLHYTLANPVSYGITDYIPLLPSLPLEDELYLSLSLENTISTLTDLDIADISYENKYTYQVLLSYLNLQLEGSSFYYFPEIFSPSQGVQSSYPILMAEYDFQNINDIKNYLSLLSQTKDYFSNLILWENLRNEHGYCMPNYSLEKVILQCDTMISKEELSSNSHFLQTSFAQKCQTLVDENIMTTSEMASYITQNNEILYNTVMPAYQLLGDSLFLLKDSSTNEDGLHYQTNGSSYYQWLLKKNTGSARLVDEIFSMLQTDYAENITSLRSLLEAQTAAQTFSENDLYLFSLNDPNEILQDLSGQMENNFPTLLLDASVTVKNVDSSLEDYTSPAFYMIPPIDDSLSNTIYINQKNTSSGLDLYTTLAHEGYPGHLYQTVYYHTYMETNEIHPIRSILSFGGYVEGYAIYSEFLAYDYAANLMIQETGNTGYADLYEILKLSRKTELALLSLLDVGIHYYGLTYEEVEGTLSTYGVSDSTQIRAIYEYIVEEPAVYPKYYVGYLEILSLQEAAITLWENEYSDYRFHEFLLNSGPSDFANLSLRLQDN